MDFISLLKPARLLLNSINVFPILVYDWIDSSVHSQLPPNAVWVGRDTDGSDMYIGRTFHENVMLPVKIIPRRREAYFAYYGKEVPATNYKVLVNHLNEAPDWVPASNGNVPPNAIQCGYNKDKYKLFVGRAYHNGIHVPGYVHPHLKTFFFPYGGHELTQNNYDVLVNRV